MPPDAQPQAIQQKKTDMQPEDGADEGTQDLFHRPNRLMSAALLIGYLSWVVLVVFVALSIAQFAATLVQNEASKPPLVYLAYSLIASLQPAATGLFYFMIMRIVSELAFLWMDTEANVRRQRSE